jgi:hypothetical protein
MTLITVMYFECCGKQTTTNMTTTYCFPVDMQPLILPIKLLSQLEIFKEKLDKLGCASRWQWEVFHPVVG